MVGKSIADIDRQMNDRVELLEPIGIENRSEIHGVLSLRKIPREAIEHYNITGMIGNAGIENLSIVSPEGVADVEWTYKRNFTNTNSSEFSDSSMTLGEL